jgi:hypothetical protein
MSQSNSEAEKIECECLNGESIYLSEPKKVGEDRWYGEVSIQGCQQCGQNWLAYFFEHEAFTRSGQWYRGPISPQQAESLKAEDAVAILQGLEWYYCGGSYYGGGQRKKSGKLSSFVS